MEKNIFLRRRRKTAKEKEENISRRKKCCGTDGGMEGYIRGPWGPQITAEQKTTEPIILQKRNGPPGWFFYTSQTTT